MLCFPLFGAQAFEILLDDGCMQCGNFHLQPHNYAKVNGPSVSNRVPCSS